MTVTRITLHIVSKRNRRRAMALLHTNTVLARKAKGFVSRRVLFANDNALKGYSITTFETRKDMENFSANPDRPPLEFKGKDRQVYEKTAKGSILLFTHTQSDLYEDVDVPRRKSRRARRKARRS